MKLAGFCHFIFHQLLFFSVKFSLVTLLFFLIFGAAVTFSARPAKTVFLFTAVLSDPYWQWKWMQ